MIRKIKPKLVHKPSAGKCWRLYHTYNGRWMAHGYASSEGEGLEYIGQMMRNDITNPIKRGRKWKLIKPINQ